MSSKIIPASDFLVCSLSLSLYFFPQSLPCCCCLTELHISPFAMRAIKFHRSPQTKNKNANHCLLLFVRRGNLKAERLITRFVVGVVVTATATSNELFVINGQTRLDFSWFGLFKEFITCPTD